jgi:hypothetical protein
MALRAPRKGRRKKKRGGWKFLLIYLVILAVAGALATALDLKLEDREKAAQASAPPGR